MKIETQYSLISDYVYSRDVSGAVNNAFNLTTLIPGAVFVSSSPINAASGFYAEAWRVNGRIVIAFRGTDLKAPNNVDILTDVALGLGSPGNAQLQDAVSFVESVRRIEGVNFSDIVFTGHSLGGGLAGLMAAKYGKDAFVYAAAPFKATSDFAEFIPDAITDAATIAILQAGRPMPPTDAGGVPNENDPTYQAALTAFDAAKAIRDGIVESNYNKIHSFGLTDELLQKLLPAVPWDGSRGFTKCRISMRRSICRSRSGEDSLSTKRLQSIV